MKRAVTRVELLLAAALAVVFGAAPTVGDVGGCGTTATSLDFAAFARARKDLDCSRCSACALATDHCKRACDPNQPSDIVLPSTCHPLAHDGEVCIDALEAASCGDYASYVADFAPTVPSECEFCLMGAATPSAPLGASKTQSMGDAAP